MKNFFKVRRNELGLCIIFLLFFSCGLVLFVTNQTGAFISLRSPHPFWVNVFFINYTFLGSGLFAIALSSYFIWFKHQNKKGVLLLSGYFFTLLIVQLIKNYCISGNFTIYSEPLQNLFFHFEMTGENYVLFPSSYTATAFTIASILILNTEKVYRKFILLSAAALVGFSRLYLVQNSVADVLIGAAIGIFSAITISYVLSYAKVLRKRKEGFFATGHIPTPAAHHAI